MRAFYLRLLGYFFSPTFRPGQIKFQAPRRPGIVPLTVFVKSPVFVGVDCQSSASFRVYRHDELKDDDDAGDW